MKLFSRKRCVCTVLVGRGGDIIRTSVCVFHHSTTAREKAAIKALRKLAGEGRVSGMLAAPIFEDPPPRNPRGGRGGFRQTWERALQPLTKAPGRWARVASYDNRYAAHTMASKLRCFTFTMPPGVWEFLARGLHVYARFKGAE